MILIPSFNISRSGCFGSFIFNCIPALAKMFPKRDSEEYLKKREKEFDLGNVGAVRLQSYNALFDPNMRHFFESKHTQYLLYKTGQIDQHGRVIDLEKNKSKLFILEKEFAAAEKLEEQRQKEEMEMRVCIGIFIILHK